MAGFVGSDIYFSDTYRPYAWPVAYMQTVDYPVVALAPLQQSLLVLTTGAPYLINAADPANTSMEKLDFHQACVSDRSVAQFGNGVIYASPDGLVYVGTDGSRNLTQGWFTRETWQKMNPASIRGAQHDGRYYGFYTGATLANMPANGGFVFDPSTQLGTFTTTAVTADAVYADTVQDALFISQGNTIYKWEAAAATQSYVWRSKVFTAPKPINFSAAQVQAADYQNIAVSFYVDGTLVYTHTVANQEPFRLPSGFLGTRFEVEFSGTSTLLSFAMAETLTELTSV